MNVNPKHILPQAKMRWRIVSHVLYGLVTLLYAWPVRAAVTAVATADIAFNPLQVFYIANLLSAMPAGGTNPEYTRESVVLALYNGAATPCFSVVLPYGMSVSLGTGGLSPCVAPVLSVSAFPLPGLYGDVWAAPSAYTVNMSDTVLQMTILPQTGPTFDSTNDAIVQLGTVQFSVQSQ